MLKTALFDSLPKDIGVNSRKIVLDGPDFDISSILDFAMVTSFATFFVIYVMIEYQICSNHLYFISIGILVHENLGLDTKITFLLQ